MTSPHLDLQVKDAHQAQHLKLTGALREAQAEASQIPELRAELGATLRECSQLKVRLDISAPVFRFGSAAV